MKNFRLAPIHYVVMGLIAFGMIAIVERVFPGGNAVLLLAFFICSATVGLLIYQQKLYEVDEVEQIQYINDQAEYSLTSILDKMPVGVFKIADQNDGIEWFNPYAELILTTEAGDFDEEIVSELIHRSFEEKGHFITIGQQQFSVYRDEASKVVYFFNASNEYEATVGLATTRPVIGVISVDNYDDLEDRVSDSDISQINSFVANFVAEFADKNEIFYRRVGMDRFYLFTDYTVLESLMADKFAIIDEFRTQAKERDLSLTLSMGFSYGDSKHDEIGKVALLNLNLAEVRGGDQAVVKENQEGKTAVYFGGGTASSIKRTRTRTRAMMTAISDKIKNVDQVFIVGHKNLDMDALGSAVGMQVFASNIMDQTYVVYDPEQMSEDIAMAITRLQEDGGTNLLTVNEALPLVTKRSLLIMVDHSKVHLTLSEPFFHAFSQTVVIDHHRRDDDFPENAAITYIESGASSASELVTELIQFQKSKKNRLNKIQASIIMAGMMLDTKNFTSRVTSRTFDVASYLRTRGSDSSTIQEISATNFDEYKTVNELILASKQLTPSVLLAQASQDKVYSTVAISKAADSMLGMAGIEASFVVARNPEGNISISARSRSKTNVQKIMEDLGGGGHFNLAAAQIQTGTVAEAAARLEEVIIIYQQEEKELEE